MSVGESEGKEVWGVRRGEGRVYNEAVCMRSLVYSSATSAALNYCHRSHSMPAAVKFHARAHTHTPAPKETLHLALMTLLRRSGQELVYFVLSSDIF